MGALVKNRSRRAVIGRAIQPFANRISRLLDYLKGPGGELFSVQPLESRQYLTSDTLYGSAGVDGVWNVRVDPQNSSMVQVFANAQPVDGETPIYSHDRHDLTALTINGNSGSDTLIVDYTYGTPLDGSLTFDGNGAANSVQLIGRSNLLASYAASTTANSGTITTSTQVLSFSSTGGTTALQATAFQEISVPVSSPFTTAQMQMATARVATTAVLPGTSNIYTNGTAGVGATYKRNGSGALPTIDGVSLAIGDKILVKDESTLGVNGLYVVTDLGSGSTPWILTRDISMDQTTEFAGVAVSVGVAGTANANTTWFANPSGTVTVGSTSISFYQIRMPTARVATTPSSPLPGNNYYNGASNNGIGATLTATSNGALSIDGVSVDAGDRVLVKDESSNPLRNGLYVATNPGDAGTAWVLTRDTSMDQNAEFSNALVYVDNESPSYPQTWWIANPSTAVTVGSTSIPFAPMATARLATAAALPGNTYYNGASNDGVGATLTGTGTTKLSIDGVEVAVGNRVLVKDEAGASQSHNGLYVVTNIGDGVHWILTRDTSMDQTAELGRGFVLIGNEGTNANGLWLASPSGTGNVGTINISFSKIKMANSTGATTLSLWSGTTYSTPLTYSNISYIDVGVLSSSALTSLTMTSVTDSALAAVRVRMATSGTRTITVWGSSVPIQVDTGTPSLELYAGTRATIVGDPTLNTVHIRSGTGLYMSSNSFAVSATTLSLDTGGMMDVNEATVTASTMNDPNGPSAGVISSSTGYVGYSGCLTQWRCNYAGSYTTAKLKSVQRFDFNLDGVVNDLDLNIVLNYASCAGINLCTSCLHYTGYWFDGDLNNDGYVDDSEISTILSASFPASASHPAFTSSSATKTMTVQSSVNQTLLSIDYTQPTNGITFTTWMIFWGDGTFGTMTPGNVVASHQTGSAVHIYTTGGTYTPAIFGSISGGEWVSVGSPSAKTIPNVPTVATDGPTMIDLNPPPDSSSPYTMVPYSLSIDSAGTSGVWSINWGDNNTTRWQVLGVRYATAGPLSGTGHIYYNGPANNGIGATLTENGTAALSIDGITIPTLVVGDRMLIKNETDQTRNGLYVVTNAGGSGAWVLTRDTTFDQPAEFGATVVSIGTSTGTNTNTWWQFNPSGPVAIGTTTISFSQITAVALVATTAALPTNTYAVGAAGVGATLMASSTGVLNVDNINLALNDFVLVKNEVDPTHNGLYKVTTAGVGGSPGAKYVLTRSTSVDEPAEFGSAFVPVGSAGTTNKNSGWIVDPGGTVTVGTTPISFSQISSGAASTSSGPVVIMHSYPTGTSTDQVAVRFSTTTQTFSMPPWWASATLASFSATAPEADEIDLSYGSLPGVHLDLEEAGPGDLNYHTVTNFTPDYSSINNPHSFAITGLQASSQYNFRLKAVLNGTVEYFYAFGQTPAVVPTLTAPSNVWPISPNSSGQSGVHFTWDQTVAFTVAIRQYSSASPLPLFNVSPPAEQTISVAANSNIASTHYDYAITIPTALAAFQDQLEIQVRTATEVSSWVPLKLVNTAVTSTGPGLTMTASSGGTSITTFSFGSAVTAEIYGIDTNNALTDLGSTAGASSKNVTSISASIREAIAIDATGHYSNVVWLPGVVPVVPATPTNLLATSIVDSFGRPQVSLSWDNKLNNESGFIIQREDMSLPSPSWVQLATVGPDQTAFLDTSVLTSDVYDYRVLATNAGTNSAPSNSALAWFAPLVSGIGVNPGAAAQNIPLGTTAASAVQYMPVTFIASTTPMASIGHTLSYSWSVKDGNGSTVSLPSNGATTVPSLTFTPNAAGGSGTVNLTVTDTFTAYGSQQSVSTSVAQKSFTVISGSVVQVLGPKTVSEGETAVFTASGGAGGYSWTVNGGSTIGSGVQFSFTATSTGAYAIAATSGANTGSLSLNVTHITPTVTISGPALGFVGKSLSFAGHVDLAPGVSDTLGYQWTVLNADGSVNVVAASNPSVAATVGTSAISFSPIRMVTARVATTAALPANVYYNGNAGNGIGATLTATTDGKLTVDGKDLVQYDLVLVKNEVDPTHNGLYKVTTAGVTTPVGVKYILTRDVSMDQPAKLPGLFVSIGSEGSLNPNTGWIANTSSNSTIGTSAIPFSQMQMVAARVATTTNLPTNFYSNNTPGVGATLTATNPGKLTVDGKDLVQYDLVLVKNEVDPTHNGLYKVTTQGVTGTPYVLTRYASMDEPAEFASTFVSVGGEGSINPNTGWVARTLDTVAVGTSPIPFSQTLVVTARVATAVALPSNTYSNGTAGVGATLTAANTGKLTVDIKDLVLYDLVLVKNEVDPTHNGLYKVTTQGITGIAYVLTRYASMDEPAEFASTFVSVGSEGLANPNTGWVARPLDAVNIGTSAIPFSQIQRVTARLATATALPGTNNPYVNGTAGVGAKITENGTDALLIDGVAVAPGNLVLVKNETDQTRNGLYLVTNAGGGVAWELTRDVSMNQAAKFSGLFVSVSGEGSTNPNTGWVASTSQLSTFMVPGSLAAGTYSVQLTVKDTHGATTTVLTQTSTFSVLAIPPSNSDQSSGPASSNFDWGTVPLATEGPRLNAVVQQADGKLVVAGAARSYTAYDFDQNPAEGFTAPFIARFNSDLTLDTTFGPTHTGIVVADMHSSAAPSKWSDIYAITINPVNQDIVVVGDAEMVDTGMPMFAVAEYLSATTITPQGQMIPAGTLDPAFNGGHPYTPYLTSSKTVSAGFAVSALSDGSILLGGIEATKQTTNSPIVDDFLLAKFTPGGMLDTNFGNSDGNGAHTGVAIEPGLNNRTVYTPFSTNGLPISQWTYSYDISLWYRYAADQCVRNLTVLSSGKILASGTVDTGFAMVRYNTDGSIDSTFGSSGQTYTNGADINQSADGTAVLGAVEIVPSTGDILVAGVAYSNTTADPYGYIALADYDSNGHRNTTTYGVTTSYGKSGVVKTSIAYSVTAGAWHSQDAILYDHVDSFIAENAGFIFQTNGKLVASGAISLPTDDPSNSIWRYARVSADGTPTTDGTLDTTFGTVGSGSVDVPQPADRPLGLFSPQSRSAAMLFTSDGIVSLGNLTYIDYTGLETPSNSDPSSLAHAIRSHYSNMPLVFRYRTVTSPSPRASNLTAAATPGGSVAMTWTNSGPVPDGFEIHRATAAAVVTDPAVLNSVSSLIGVVGPNQNDFVDSSVASNTPYDYEVFPFYASGSSGQRVLANSPNASIAMVRTLPSGVTTALLEPAIGIPLNGSPATSSTALLSSHTYLLVASGNIHVNGGIVNGQDTGFSGDAGYWYLPGQLQAEQLVMQVGSPDGQSIVCLIRNATTATVTVAANHGLVAGDRIYVHNVYETAYDGVFTVTGVTSTTVSFTVPVTAPTTGTPATDTGDYCLVQKVTSDKYGVGNNQTLAQSQTALAITNLVNNSGTAVATTSAAHGFVAGDTVYVHGVNEWQYDGVFTITAATTYTFSYAVPTSSPAPSTGAVPQAQKVANSQWPTAQVITGLSSNSSSNIATATTSAAHGYVVGDQVYISGVVEQQYDGLFTITAKTNTTFSYLVPAGTPTTSTGSYRQVQKFANVQWQTPQAIAGLSKSGGTVTATTATTHGYFVGDTVYIGGVTESQYDQPFIIATVSDTTHFTFSVPTSTPSPCTCSTIHVQRFSNPTYGIGINQYSDPVGSNIVPNWGLPDPTNHTYTYVITGKDQKLTFRLNDAYSADNSVQAGDQGLTVLIYDIAAPNTTSRTVRQIVSPVSNRWGSPPVISSSTPVSIISADNNPATPTSWALYLVPALGTRSLLASGGQSVGQVPNVGAQVATIDPALYLDGVYTLELFSSPSDAPNSFVDSRQVWIQNAVKSGAFTLPATDAVLSTPLGPITVSRVYNSTRTDQPGLLGHGWSLSLLDTQLHTTAQADTYNPSTATQPLRSSPVLHAGDLVYLTVPNDGQHVFAFDPIPVYESLAYEGSETSIEYMPHFAAVDGSGASLTIPSFHPSEHKYVPNRMVYNPIDDEYDSLATLKSVPNSGQLIYFDNYLEDDFGFNPARGVFANQYQLTTKDGAAYVINATTGQIEMVTDTNGNQTTYSTSSDGSSITAVSQSNETLLTIQLNSSHAITEIDVPSQSPILYSYDASGNLVSVQNQVGDITRYAYQDPSHPSALTSVINPQGVNIVQAQYDPVTGRIQTLINATGQTIPVGSIGFGANQATQTAIDAAGNVTENVFDEKYGTSIRKIQTITNGATVLDYVVTVTSFSYVIHDAGQVTALHRSGVPVLQSIQQYASFQVAGADAAGLRYSQQPDPSTWITNTIYSTSADSNDAGHNQVLSVSERTTSDGVLQTTTYSNYAVFHKPVLESNGTYALNPDGTYFFPIGIVKPQLIIQEIQRPNGRGYDNHVQSVNYTQYDDSGNVEKAVVSEVWVPAAGSDPTGHFLAEGKRVEYTTASSTEVGGLEANTVNITAWIVPNAALPGGYGLSDDHFQDLNIVTTNTYYSATDLYDSSDNTGIHGAIFGGLRYNFDAALQETYYAYDSIGHTILKYVYKQWTDPSGTPVSGWVGETNVYDSRGRMTDTYQATYTDSAGLMNGADHVLATTSGGQNGVAVAEDPYAYTPIVHTVHNDYDPQGQLLDSIDQFGGMTSYTYDAAGHKIRTVNPDGTEIRSIYDALGREIYKTDLFVPVNSDPSSSANTAMLTGTVYNQLGQVTATQRIQNGVIEITSAKTGSVAMAQSVLGPNGTVLGTTYQWFNPAKQMIGSKNPAGLCTGTVYYPNGQAQYSGPLLNTAPDCSAPPANGVATRDYVVSPTSDFVSYTTYQYNNWDSTKSMLYDRVIDANDTSSNHTYTDTYRDPKGRTVRVVYPDGSFAETLYSIGTTTVSKDQEGNNVDTPTSGTGSEGWPGVAAGGSEVVDIAQRMSGNAAVTTYHLYNEAGRLTDVWQPAVTTPTNSTPTRPHTTYAYDAAGNETTQTDALVRVTSCVYDQDGNQIQRTLPQITGQSLKSETSAYDQFDRMVWHKDFIGQVTAYEYEPDSRFGGREITEYRFTSASIVNGVLQTAYSSANEKTAYGYDSLGRRVTVTEYVNSNLSTPVRTETTTYDNITQQVSSSTTPEGVIQYAYAPSTGRHVRTWITHGSTVTNETDFAYDSQGRLADVYAVVLHGTRYATYSSLDSSGNPTFTSGTPKTTVYTYDNDGNLKTEVLPTSNATTTTYSYDSLNRLTDVAVTIPSNKTLFTQHYDLNNNGLRKDVVETRYETDGSTVFSKIRIDWGYDALDRLTSEAETVQQGNANNSPAAYTNVFAFDLVGNRMSETIKDGSGTTTATIAYTYDNDDRLSTETRSISATYSTTYGYDNNGSLTSQARTGSGAISYTYVYDLRNRMTSVAIAGGSTTSYGYDSHGVRVKETTGSTSTYFLNDPKNPAGFTKTMEESNSLNSSTLTKSYELGHNVVAQQDSTNGILYLIHDGHGSTRVVLNSSASIIEMYNYDSFGALLNSTGTLAGTSPAVGAQSNATAALTRWLFAGDGIYDPSSGWTYQLARWRNGFTFTQMDGYAGDIQDPLSLHKYVYANDNPISGRDPSGYFTFVDTLAAAGRIAQDVGTASMFAGAAGFVVSLAEYYGASRGLAFALEDRNLSGITTYMDMQIHALQGMEISGYMVAGGAMAYLAGTVMLAAASMIAAMSVNGSGNAILRDGYYEVNGFRFSQYYYEKLWSTGRPAPSLIAKLVLEGAGGGVADPNKLGFYRYVCDGWELVYNPVTREIWHLQPLNR